MVPDPKMSAPTDAIVSVDATTICGSDLHIVKGDLLEFMAGRVAQGASSPDRQ